MTANACPDCGAAVAGGRDGCQALWDELVHGHGISHPAAFDAYCMQHLEQYCASAKSYAAHLTRLYCGVEHGGNPRLYAAIQRWLNGNRQLDKPAILPFLGALTIADIAQAAPARHAAVTAAWVESVWAAYAPQHELAQQWLQTALWVADR